MRNVLVIGHRGMLGTDLVAHLEGIDDVDVRGVDLQEVDIIDRESVENAIDAAGADVVINCAAWTAVDDAESHPHEAQLVNGLGAGNVAVAANSRGALMVQISTDFVFDGKKRGPYVEEDEPGPLSVYGKTKLEGEKLVARFAEDHLVVRTSWLYGPASKNFVTTILGLAEKAERITVVDDQVGSPTYTKDLSRAIWELIKVDARGIVHAAGAGKCSWHRFAREIARQRKLSTKVLPITSEELKRPAPRPTHSVLDTSRLTRVTGFRFPRWQDSLADFLTRLSSVSDR